MIQILEPQTAWGSVLPLYIYIIELLLLGGGMDETALAALEELEEEHPALASTQYGLLLHEVL